MFCTSGIRYLVILTKVKYGDLALGQTPITLYNYIVS